jgi:hypothetical protein
VAASGRGTAPNIRIHVYHRELVDTDVDALFLRFHDALRQRGIEFSTQEPGATDDPDDTDDPTPRAGLRFRDQSARTGSALSPCR